MDEIEYIVYGWIKDVKSSLQVNCYPNPFVNLLKSFGMIMAGTCGLLRSRVSIIVGILFQLIHLLVCLLPTSFEW